MEKENELECRIIGSNGSSETESKGKQEVSDGTTKIKPNKKKLLDFDDFPKTHPIHCFYRQEKEALEPHVPSVFSVVWCLIMVLTLVIQFYLLCKFSIKLHSRFHWVLVVCFGFFLITMVLVSLVSWPHKSLFNTKIFLIPLKVSRRSIYLLVAFALSYGLLLFFFLLSIYFRADVITETELYGRNKLRITIGLTMIVVYSYYQILRGSDYFDPLNQITRVEIIEICLDVLDTADLFCVAYLRDNIPGYVFYYLCPCVIFFWIISVSMRILVLPALHLPFDHFIWKFFTSKKPKKIPKTLKHKELAIPLLITDDQSERESEVEKEEKETEKEEKTDEENANAKIKKADYLQTERQIEKRNKIKKKRLLQFFSLSTRNWIGIRFMKFSKIFATPGELGALFIRLILMFTYPKAKQTEILFKNILGLYRIASTLSIKRIPSDKILFSVKKPNQKTVSILYFIIFCICYTFVCTYCDYFIYLMKGKLSLLGIILTFLILSLQIYFYCRIISSLSKRFGQKKNKHLNWKTEKRQLKEIHICLFAIPIVLILAFYTRIPTLFLNAQSLNSKNNFLDFSTLLTVIQTFVLPMILLSKWRISFLVSSMVISFFQSNAIAKKLFLKNKKYENDYFKIFKSKFIRLKDISLSLLYDETITEGTMDLLSAVSFFSWSIFPQITKTDRNFCIILIFFEFLSMIPSNLYAYLMFMSKPTVIAKSKFILKGIRIATDLCGAIFRIVVWQRYGILDSVFLLKNVFHIMHGLDIIVKSLVILRTQNHTFPDLMFPEYINRQHYNYY
ncbi:hypothetical protein M0813_11309 [Anaeramoeba flamelloides]|uniref:Uncharacterized protein n=1 Tax=Anaeramoeba flamelloides TaxID=1746091 RepID=A0ABQ8ZFD6_9EUKA|nr:hypothetical protein M0813_11309 [Anaeramoeba flamelloides]